jgi:hypothetical protein
MMIKTGRSKWTLMT